LTFLIVLALVAGILIYIFQYRKRKLMNIKEQDILKQQHLQQLLTTELQSQQQTMQYIGREIHDNVGQKLTLASLYSKQVLSTAVFSPEKVSTICNIIDESLAELRQLSKSLTNTNDAATSLIQLLHEEAERINLLGNCYIQVSSTGEKFDCTMAQKNILFRILQEFIQNSLKHSGCERIKIDVNASAAILSITATDDGKGFNSKQKYSGIGLNNMRRRAEEINIEFQLTSGSEKGTTLLLKMHL
jgi:signal transduction histidine kinase